MAEQTGIAWTDHTFNPWWGCTKVSDGCKNCYADTLSSRFGFDIWGPGKPRRTFGVKHWAEPLKWDKAAQEAGERRRVFCASMADVFDAEGPAEARAALWSLIGQTPNLDWLLLTKRPENVARMVPEWWLGDGWPENVWLGTSVENQEQVHRRIPELEAIPAKVRFLSCEPLLERIDLLAYRPDWVIVGGESGHGHRPFNEDWARNIRDWCAKKGVAFFFKQHGGVRPTDGGHLLDGQAHYEWPRTIKGRSEP